MAFFVGLVLFVGLCGLDPARGGAPAGRVLLYWRAADRTSPPATGAVSPAVVTGALLVSSVVVLALDAFGI